LSKGRTDYELKYLERLHLRNQDWSTILHDKQEEVKKYLNWGGREVGITQSSQKLLKMSGEIGRLADLKCRVLGSTIVKSGWD
jgi:hypothetical protein